MRDGAESQSGSGGNVIVLLLRRLRRAKLVLLSVITVVLSIGLLVGAAYQDSHWKKGLPHALPLKDVGLTLLPVGLVLFAFEAIVRQEAAGENEVVIRNALRDERAAVRQAVLDSIRLADRLVEATLSDTELDDLIVASLKLRVGDNDLARAVYEDFVAGVGSTREIWQNLVVNIWLSDDPDFDAADEYFGVSFKFSYRAPLLRPEFTLAAMTGVEEFNDMLRGTEWDVVWRLPSVPDFHGRMSEAFKVTVVKINSEDLTLDVSVSDERQFVVGTHETMRGLVGQIVDVEYSFTSKVRKNGHMLSMEIPRPCRGATYSVYFGGCGIAQMRVIDYFSVRHLAQIDYIPKERPTSVYVSSSDILIPKSGVSFVWTLAQETKRRRRRGGLPASGKPQNMPSPGADPV